MSLPVWFSLSCCASDLFALLLSHGTDGSGGLRGVDALALGDNTVDGMGRRPLTTQSSVVLEHPWGQECTTKIPRYRLPFEIRDLSAYVDVKVKYSLIRLSLYLLPCQVSVVDRVYR